MVSSFGHYTSLWEIAEGSKAWDKTDFISGNPSSGLLKNKNPDATHPGFCMEPRRITYF